VDLDQATAELYAMPPGDFTGRRAELVAAARAAGDAELAKAIGGLRRPTVAAWAVNLLAGDTGLEQLFRLGEQVRAAQAALDGAAIRELGRQRQTLVSTLVKRAGELASQAGQQVGAGVQRELEETFGAAIADPRAAEAVGSGVLTRALAYAGIGEVDVDAAVALPRPTAKVDRPRTLRAVPAPTEDQGRQAAQAAREQQARQDAEAAVTAAREQRDGAAAELAASRQRHERAQGRERELHESVDRLQDELARARRELIAATHQIGSAERELGHRQRVADRAGKELAAAERALAALDDLG
jgi:hypothetical protein